METTSSHRNHSTSHRERHTNHSRVSPSRSSSPHGRSKRRSRSISPRFSSDTTRELRHKRSRRDSSTEEKPKHKSKKKAKKRKEEKHHTGTISVEELRSRVSEAKEKEKGKERIYMPASVLFSSAQSQPPKRPIVPQTKNEYTKEQSIIREVYDPLSGRTRLVKGSGEIIERIVTRDQHREINQIATRGDGSTYQAQMSGFLKI